MTSFGLRCRVAIAGFVAASSCWADPVAPTAPVDVPGDGLRSYWVNTDFSPHSIEEALAALDLLSGDDGFVSAVDQVVPYIDFFDGCVGFEPRCAGTIAETTLPALGDDVFAVRYSGYLNVKSAGEYAFRSLTDDGFRLTLGGEVISEFVIDRAPDTTEALVTLGAGFYPFEFVSWEQGEIFVDELIWRVPGAPRFTVPGSGTEKVFFTAPPGVVAAPGAAGIWLAVLAPLAWACRRRRRTATRGW